MEPASPVLLRADARIAEVVIAKDQPQYRPLPAIFSDDNNRVTTRWALTWRERWRVLLGGSVYLQVLTFGRSLQPVILTAEEPVFDVAENG